MSFTAIVAVIWLAIYEARTGQKINPVAYYILAWVVFWLQSEQIMRIVDSFKNRWSNRSEEKTNLQKDTEKQSS